MKKNYFPLIIILFMHMETFATADNHCEKEFSPNALSTEENIAILAACSAGLDDIKCIEMEKSKIKRKKIYETLANCPNTRSKTHKSALIELQKFDPVIDLPEAKTNEPWLISLSLGQQYLPDYSTGENEGFNNSQAFAEIILDKRVFLDSGRKIHWGTMLTFEGQPINTEKTKSPSEVEFNDVADTLTAGIYAIYMFKNNDHSNYEDGWGAAGRISLRSRESIGEKKDTLDEIAEIGIHYRYNTTVTKYGNVMPRATLSIGGGYWNNYEEYMSESNSDLRYRFLFRGEYRLAENTPIYLGIRGNTGKGADNIAVYLSLRMSTNKLLGLLSDQ